MNIPWWEVQGGGKELERLSEVVTSNYFNEGKVVSEFENNISEITNSKLTVTCSSGTTAIFMALKAIGMRSGSKIAVPDLTFIATANAAKLTGAKVILVDINIETLGVSLESLKEAHRKERIDTLILVHVSGRSAWSSEISEFCKTEGIVIIEDAAEAFGSRDPETGKMLGTIGELGAYSFSPNKIITTGQGGAVVSNKAKYLDTLHALKDQGRPTRGTGGPDLHPFEGYNFKLTNLQAAVGLAQLEQYENRRRHLARVYHEYKSRIQTCPHLKLLNFNLEKGEVPLWPDLFVINREELISSLRENHIGYREIWLPIHTQKKYLHSSKDFPNAVLASAHIVWLPSAFSLNKYMIEKIVRNLNCRMCHSG